MMAFVEDKFIVKDGRKATRNIHRHDGARTFCGWRFCMFVAKLAVRLSGDRAGRSSALAIISRC